jgi:hypothetical protein
MPPESKLIASAFRPIRRTISIGVSFVVAVASLVVIPRSTAQADALSLQPGVLTARTASGTTPFDATSFNVGTGTDAGTDANATNDVVRTGQLTNFRFDLSLNDPKAADPETHANYTLTTNALPLGFRWDSLPAVCTGAGSKIIGDGKTVSSQLICNLGAKTTGDAFFMSANVMTLNSAHNGDVFEVTATVKVDDTANTAASTGPKTYATSSPRWDLTKRYSGVAAYKLYPDRNGALKAGYVLRYNVGIKAPLGGGAEPLQLPLTISENISGISANAVFYDAGGPACAVNNAGGVLPYGSLAIGGSANTSVGDSGTDHGHDAQRH